MKNRLSTYFFSTMNLLHSVNFLDVHFCEMNTDSETQCKQAQHGADGKKYRKMWCTHCVFLSLTRFPYMECTARFSVRWNKKMKCDVFQADYSLSFSSTMCVCCHFSRLCSSHLVIKQFWSAKCDKGLNYVNELFTLHCLSIVWTD